MNYQAKICILGQQENATCSPIRPGSLFQARRLGKNGKMSGNVSSDFINGIVNVYEPGHKDALEWSFGSARLIPRVHPFYIR